MGELTRVLAWRRYQGRLLDDSEHREAHDRLELAVRDGGRPIRDILDMACRFHSDGDNSALGGCSTRAAEVVELGRWLSSSTTTRPERIDGATESGDHVTPALYRSTVTAPSSPRGNVRRDRAVGAIVASAAGDALGAPYEFDPALPADAVPRMQRG